ncbi:unnamed protein product, partial [Polarella glacialis]
DYRVAVAAQSSTVWHQQATSLAVDALRKAGAERVLDIGSSFNPLHGLFPSVTALDVVPAHESVLVADFLEVELREGLADVLVDPTDSSRCVAVPAGGYDGALLSMVLRAFKSLESRREMVRRAALTLRPGGVLVIVERTYLGTMLKIRTDKDTFWASMGLRKIHASRAARGTSVDVFQRIDGGGTLPTKTRSQIADMSTSDNGPVKQFFLGWLRWLRTRLR